MCCNPKHIHDLVVLLFISIFALSSSSRICGVKALVIGDIKQPQPRLSLTSTCTRKGHQQRRNKWLHLGRLHESKGINHDNHNRSSENNSEKISTLRNGGEITAPSIQKIIQFAIPAIGISLCSPLLSLIDTSAVGLLSGTAQQAALNPAITITDDGALLLVFMYAATTNIVASAYEQDRYQSDKTLTKTTMVTSLQLSILVGTLFGLALILSAPVLCRVLLGKNSVTNNPEIFSYAKRYVQIRALGGPASCMIGSAQSASLGIKDIRSPLVVMILAAIVNFCGDIIFVPRSHPWIGGSAGAAWATVISQYTALAMFIFWLKMKPIDKAGVGNASNTHNSSLPTRGFLHGKLMYRDLIRFPKSVDIVKKFLPYVVPVTTTAIGRVSGYVAMSHIVSSVLGAADMASQQIVLAFFFCFIPICDSLNLTAQSFVPGIFEYQGDDRRLRSQMLNKTIEHFLKVGCIFGFVLTGIVSCMPLVSRFFSHDPLVIASANATTPFLVIFFLLSGIFSSSEGLLLGQKDLGFLGKTFSIFFFAVPYFMFRLKRLAIAGTKTVGIDSIWKIFSIYQVVRCSVFLARLKILSKRNECSDIMEKHQITS